METASLCIQVWNDKYYLHAITAADEEHFYFPISRAAAMTFNAVNGSGIYTDIEVTPDMVTA